MTKKGSNRNIYIFWGSIALIIVVVLLVIFLPRVNMAKGFNNMYEMSVCMNKGDSYEKNMTFYAEQFINSSSLSTTEKSKTQALLHLQKAMENSTNYALNGLQFVENKNNFSNLAKTQSSYFSQAQNTINQFLDYCQNYVYKWFDGSTTENITYFNQVFGVYVQKYQIVVQQLSDFYVASANILSSCALKGIEITEINLQKNQEYMLSIKEQAYLENTNASKCSEIFGNTETYYYQFN